MKQIVDYIIVGSGLAGISLAHALLKRNKRIIIFNSTDLHSSTQVAAGLYNPITGRVMKKTWRADILFPVLHSYYIHLEKLTGSKFLIDKNIYRPFFSLEEQNEWMGKSAQPEYASYLHKIHTDSFHENINNPFGGIELSQSGYLDTTLFYEAMRLYFRSRELLSDDAFDPSAIDFSGSHVAYGNIHASKVIFCEGTYLASNPYFRWLPFSPVKGEILTVEAPLNIDVIVNRGVFCVPLGDNTYRVGSNYEHNDLTWESTEQGKIQIEEKLGNLIGVPFKTIHQKAGVRPSTKDRKPYVGIHPSKETIGVFNGLGTKGVSLAPYFGEHFAAFLEGEIELDDEVNINRYFSLS